MEISSVSSLSYQPPRGAESFNTMKQLFDKLGNALESGDLSEAQDAMAELQKKAPPQKAGDDDNPMKTKMEKLSQSLGSGDLSGAQEAYADLKNTLAQGPPAGSGRPGGPGGPPPNGAQQTSGVSNSSSSSASQTYDKKDLNQDGTVTAAEELLYSLEHPDDASTSSSSSGNSNSQGLLDVTA